MMNKITIKQYFLNSRKYFIAFKIIFLKIINSYLILKPIVVMSHPIYMYKNDFEFKRHIYQTKNTMFQDAIMHFSCNF